MRLTTVTLFVFFNVMYYLVFVVGIGVLGFSGKSIHGFSPSNSVDTALMLFNFVQSIIGFGAAYILFRGVKSTEFIRYPYSGDPSKQLARLYAFAALAILSFLVFKLSIFNISYSTAYTYRAENSSSAYLQTLFYVFSAISISICVSLGEKFSPTNVVLGVSMAMFVLLTGDKNALVIAFFALVYSMRVYNVKIKVGRIVALVLFVTFILFLTSFLRFYRAGMDVQSAIYMGFYSFDVLSLDGAGPLISIIHVMENPTEYLLGSRYINDIYNIIPRFIWPGRPITASEEFAQSVISNWQPGMGLGYSPYAEAQNNWGPYFIFLHFFIFGAAWFLIWGLVARMFAIVCKNGDMISRIYYVYGAYLLLLSFRSTSLSFIKGMTHFFAAVFILHICHTLLSRASRGAVQR